MKQYLQLLQLTLIPSVEYHFNKNVMDTKDTTVIGMNKKIDDDDDVIVNFSSIATSKDMSTLLDLLLDTHEMLVLRAFSKHKGLHVLCDIMDYVLMGERRGDDKLRHQRDRLYLLESFIGSNMFVHGQKSEIMDDKHKGVVGSANLYLDEHPVKEDLRNPSHNYWVYGNTNRRVLMLLKLLDILLHLETCGALTSVRIVQNTPRHPR